VKLILFLSDSSYQFIINTYSITQVFWDVTLVGGRVIAHVATDRNSFIAFKHYKNIFFSKTPNFLTTSLAVLRSRFM